MQNNEASVQGRARSGSNTRRDWIILGVLLAAGILTLPPGGDASTVSAGIAGVCFGAAAMLMVFRFGRKQPEDVK
jgi:hypothetical protein